MDKEKVNEYEYKDLPICKYGLQRECRKCLFENLCRLEKDKKDMELSSQK